MRPPQLILSETWTLKMNTIETIVLCSGTPFIQINKIFRDLANKVLEHDLQVYQVISKKTLCFVLWVFEFLAQRQNKEISTNPQ